MYAIVKTLLNLLLQKQEICFIILYKKDKSTLIPKMHDHQCPYI